MTHLSSSVHLVQQKRCNSGWRRPPNDLWHVQYVSAQGRRRNEGAHSRVRRLWSVELMGVPIRLSVKKYDLLSSSVSYNSLMFS